MVKCHLSRLLGERKLKISDVVRDTGINRGTLTRLYHETAQRVELKDLEASTKTKVRRRSLRGKQGRKQWSETKTLDMRPEMH